MFVIPDDREKIYYDIMQILDMEPEQLAHYWSTLIDRFKLIDDGKILPVCSVCKSTKVVRHLMPNGKKKLICRNNIHVEYDEIKGKISAVGITLDTNLHKVLFMSQNEMLEIIIGDVLELMREAGGYVPTLFQIELFLWGQDMDAFFETIHGEVSKSKITEKLSLVQDFITERLIDLRKNIRFTYYGGGMGK